MAVSFVLPPLSGKIVGQRIEGSRSLLRKRGDPPERPHLLLFLSGDGASAPLEFLLG